ncbi:hypothetical protein [Encephalitozoon cuniculi GB-M1]|uniref:Autophagy-related protein 9 n=2 Tax=Encephalitozoon cuniculi TaxID=6035 RepID=Q8SU83_ENCCU|nr:uncharacterized protein ECU11_0270 [Encephalitozoon cuniculi GB-M1]AGE94890.1 hypothetical protein ECU11_0270 [Encephalitozoon cuniculi]KMV64982.1 hypothetical protein M970_110210 [Encephalitozoon cuniculi EcunIII-L]CAD25937.1 hypothetical protein [Encephalitozoon cuniculi GB-M1]
MRNVFITGSLCLTVYLTSNMDVLRSNEAPSVGMNFSSATLVVGGVFVMKEVVSWMINLKKMISIFYMYRYVLSGDMEKKTRFRDIVEGVIKLEKEIHNRDLRREDVRGIVSRGNLLVLLIMKKFPSIFHPTCSRFFLYILHAYVHKIEEGPVEELGNEIRVVSVVAFILSPVISIFLILYYIARIIEKSQSSIFYVFRKAHRPSFKYFMSKKDEFPHETQKRIRKGTRYLNAFFLSKKRDCIVGICSAISFFLSCMIFLVVYLILNTILVSRPSLNGVLYQDISLLGKTTNVMYLSYFIGGISCCLRCLSFDYATTNRRRMFVKWCVLMEQKSLVEYSGNRGYLTALISKFFVPRIYLFLVEIISPFFVPFQLERLRARLERIHIMLNSMDELEEHDTETQGGRASILDL